MVEKGDSKFSWVAKFTQISHAEKTGRPGNTVCGLKIGKKWFRAAGEGHAVYSKKKCPTCKTTVKRALRALSR